MLPFLCSFFFLSLFSSVLFACLVLIRVAWCRPQGVGMGRNPPLWLKDGDVVEVELDGVGTCTNKVEFTAGRDAKL